MIRHDLRQLLRSLATRSTFSDCRSVSEGFANTPPDTAGTTLPIWSWRDATIHSYLVPLEWVGGFLAYKEGQAAIKFLAEATDPSASRIF